jgi:hypothetical protein
VCRKSWRNFKCYERLPNVGPRRQSLTGFGVALRRVMDARAMRRWTELFDALERVGYPRNLQTMMDYVYAEQPVDEQFVRYIAAALSLTNDERERLAYAWAYLQGRDGEPKTHLHKVAETFGWDEQKKRQEAYHYLFEPFLT